jgi:hypothetical protein
MFWVWSAQERLARICFGLDDSALWCYLLLLRSALEETRAVFTCLLCRVLWKRLAFVFAYFAECSGRDSGWVYCFWVVALN